MDTSQDGTQEPERRAAGTPGTGQPQVPVTGIPVPGPAGDEGISRQGQAGFAPACSAFRTIRQLVPAGRE